jgi:hypothetical protein
MAEEMRSTEQVSSERDEDENREHGADEQPPEEAVEEPSLGRRVLFWGMCIVIGGLMLVLGAIDLLNFAGTVQRGEPQWLRYGQGFFELPGAVLLLVPRTRFYGAALLIPGMLLAILKVVIYEPMDLGVMGMIFNSLIPFYFMIAVLAGIVARYHLPDWVLARLPQREDDESPPIF